MEAWWVSQDEKETPRHDRELVWVDTILKLH